MTIYDLTLPKWVVKTLNDMYPNVSTHAAIKHYLKDSLNALRTKEERLRQLNKEPRSNGL